MNRSDEDKDAARTITRNLGEKQLDYLLSLSNPKPKELLYKWIEHRQARSEGQLISIAPGSEITSVVCCGSCPDTPSLSCIPSMPSVTVGFRPK